MVRSRSGNRNKRKVDPSSRRLVEACDALQRATDARGAPVGRLFWIDVEAKDEPWFAYFVPNEQKSATLVMTKGAPTYTEFTRLADGGDGQVELPERLVIHTSKWSEASKETRALFERAGISRQGGEKVVCPTAMEGAYPRPLRGEEMRVSTAALHALASAIEKGRATEAEFCSGLQDSLPRITITDDGDPVYDAAAPRPETFEPYLPTDPTVEAVPSTLDLADLPQLPHHIELEWSGTPIRSTGGTEWLRLVALFSGLESEPVAFGFVDPADPEDLGAFLSESFHGANRAGVRGRPSAIVTTNNTLLAATKSALEQHDIAAKTGDPADARCVARLRDLRASRGRLLGDRLASPSRDLEWTLLERQVLRDVVACAMKDKERFEAARTEFSESLGDARRVVDGLGDAFAEWLISDPRIGEEAYADLNEISGASRAILDALATPRFVLAKIDRTEPGFGMRRNEPVLRFTDQANGASVVARARRITDTERPGALQILRVYDYGAGAGVLPRIVPVTPAIVGGRARQLESTYEDFAERIANGDDPRQVILGLTRFWGE